MGAVGKVKHLLLGFTSQHVVEFGVVLLDHLIGQLRVGLLDFLDHMHLRDLEASHDGKSDLGSVERRVMDGVGGDDVLAWVRWVRQQEAVVGVDGESRVVGGRDGESKGVAWSNNVRCVPEIALSTFCRK